ncbi:NAD(P)H-binding protein [Pontibacillus sp. HMF3514]|uniref:NAD(P)H-binding protein n=1 Tax=Pontibacillus sp. HMF3514 TaxID=2692425 RepID=UPI0013203309|nr:NAD(P)H-binding protein [Pontibacillus sp. HMF3514]QHE53354.1 NAD(P)H-binding protein [Pontibacillus sp. HMF3514]
MNSQFGERPVVALTGASGYIGQNLLRKLTKFADVIALSRNGDKHEDTEHVTWRSCDLFSLSDAEKGLKGADFAVYLVHSMKPSAKLTQGSFEDMDIILADNFAQAAQRQGVKQIVYLSGLIPKSRTLSRHLQSRLEVEKILGSYEVPVTTIRAGLIVGPKGSSFPILAKLVRRLPVMTLPKWTRTKTHPIALPDVLHALDYSIGNPQLSGESIDVGGPEVMTYKDMMHQTAEVMGKKPIFINVPFLSIKLSRLWVSLVTGSSKEMVYPLIESLSYPMTAQPENMSKDVSYGKIPFKEAACTSLKEEKREQDAAKKTLKPKTPIIQYDVRSVQRIPIPEGKNALWVARYYTTWLSHLVSPFLRVEEDEDQNCQICIMFSNLPLLELSYSPERSTPNRVLYYITGGIFENAEKNERGRLEFRQIPGGQECIVAIHDYMPSLPWFIYKYTQAKAHLWVMYQFKRHLKNCIKQGETLEEKRIPQTQIRTEKEKVLR